MKKKPKDNFPLIWKGVYSSWLQCVQDAAGQDGIKGFSNDEWLSRIHAQLEELREEFKKYKISVPPRPCTLPYLISFVKPESIIDLGGSSGWVFEYLKSLNLEKELKNYSILEVDSIVKFSKKFKHPKKVVYLSEIKNNEKFDLLYTNSVIQYFPNNDYLIDMISKVQPTHLLFDDLYAGNQKEFYSHQINYDRLIPHRFMNFKSFNKDMEACGYKMISKIPFHTPIRGVYQPKPMENFEPAYRLRYSLSVIYKKSL